MRAQQARTDAYPTMSGQQGAETAVPARSQPYLLPLIDPQALQRLEEHLEDAMPARAFAQDYIDNWNRRDAQLVSTVRQQDLDAALDAALSLLSASIMIGALRLAGLSEDFRQALEDTNLHAAHSYLAAITQCGRATVLELETTYLQPSGRADSPLPAAS